MDWPDPCRRAPCDAILRVAERAWDSGARAECRGSSSAWGQKTMPFLGRRSSNVSTSVWPRLSHALEEGSLPTFPFLAEL